MHGGGGDHFSESTAIVALNCAHSPASDETWTSGHPTASKTLPAQRTGLSLFCVHLLEVDFILKAPSFTHFPIFAICCVVAFWLTLRLQLENSVFSPLFYAFLLKIDAVPSPWYRWTQWACRTLFSDYFLRCFSNFKVKLKQSRFLPYATCHRLLPSKFVLSPLSLSLCHSFCRALRESLFSWSVYQSPTCVRRYLQSGYSGDGEAPAQSLKKKREKRKSS